MISQLYPLSLLERASAIFDAESFGLNSAAKLNPINDFADGALWMAKALQGIRFDEKSSILYFTRRKLNSLGFLKYGLAGLFAALVALALLFFNIPLFFVAIATALAFYFVEVQMVFIFPLLIDGDPNPIRSSRKLVRRFGGALKSILTAIPLAICMLFGGFFGKGFVRCWCIGCLSVVLWYEDIRSLR